MGASAMLLLVETTMAFAVDPVFMAGIVAICAIVVFALAVVAVTKVNPSEGVAQKALETLVALIRSLVA